MTVASEVSRIVYTGAGTTGPFPVPFYFLEDVDLTVIKTLISDGTETTLTLTTDYTVAGAADPAGGSVTLVAALSALYKLTIVRDPDSLQETDYQTGDPFPAESHERALDKLTMIVQRVLDKVNRAFRLSDGDVSGVGLTLSNLVANRVLAVNSAGDGIEGKDIIDLTVAPVSTFMATLLTNETAVEAATTLSVLPVASGTLLQTKEAVAINASAPSATQNFNFLSGAFQYFTTNGANNWTLNLRGDATTTLNSQMSVGESITITLMAVMGATAYYSSAMTIDGAAVTPKWLGGTAPTFGDTNCVNVYTYTVIKTADATFTVIAAKTRTS